MKKDIEIKWNKKEEDLEVTWREGKGTAIFILELFDKGFQKKLWDRGYDLTSLKFSINRRKL